MAQTKFVTLDTVVCSQYQWINGVTYTTDTAVLLSRNDTMFVLNLSVDREYTSQPAVDLEKGCSYTWFGHLLTTDTTLTDTLKTVKGGCDSIATINLTLTHKHQHDTVVMAPHSYEWRGITFTADTVVADSASAADGTCDSIFTLDLTITKYEKVIDKQVCGSYYWQIVHPRDTIWADMGGYSVRQINYDTLLDTTFFASTNFTFDNSALDTIYKLNLQINGVYDTVETSTCGAYNWHGIQFAASSVYDTTLVNPTTMCDSNLHLTLTIKAQIDSTKATSCGSYVWNVDSVRYTRDTVVSLNILNNDEDGTATCDTIIKVLSLKITHFTDTTTQVACGSFNWQVPALGIDTIIYKGSADSNGIFTLSQYTADTTTLCDSTFVLALTFNNIVDTVKAEACTIYQWRDTTFTASTNTTFTFTDEENSCDSVFVLDINIFNKIDTTDVAACGSYTYKDSTYTASTTIISFETDANGCRTEHYLNLSLVENLTDTTEAEACGSYTWHDSTYLASTVFIDTIASTDSTITCDSIVTLKLTITRLDAYDTMAACGSVKWNDVTYYNNDEIYYSTTDSVTKCVTRHYLTINITEKNTIAEATACEKYDYTFNGNFEPVSGTITQNEYRRVVTVDTVTRCVTNNDLNITIIPVNKVLVTREVSACDNYRFKVGDSTRYFTASFNDTITAIKRGATAATCYDSSAVLNLKINGKTYTNPNNPTENICDNFEWFYSFNKVPVSQGSTDSTLVIDSTKTRLYTRSVKDTILLGHDVNGCDSLAVLDLTVYRTPVVTILGELDLEKGETAHLSYECDQPRATHIWNYNGTTKNTPEITIENVQTNIDVTLVSTGDGGCVSTKYITVMANENLGIEDIESAQVSLYPNPTTAYLNLSSEQPVSEVTIFNNLGQKVSTASNLGTATTLDLSSFATGTYSMRITFANGETLIRKFIVSK